MKERVCAIVNTLPFENYPHRLIVERVYSAVFWLNFFPQKNGVQATLSPRAIITGSHIDYKRHCRLQFGSYVQVHNLHYNSLLPRMSTQERRYVLRTMQKGTAIFDVLQRKVCRKYQGQGLCGRTLCQQYPYKL